MEEWIEHDGGPCPVSSDTQRHAILRNGPQIIGRADSVHALVTATGERLDLFERGNVVDPEVYVERYKILKD